MKMSLKESALRDDPSSQQSECLCLLTKRQMNQFPLSLSGLGQDHFHPWGWNKEGSNHQHSRPTAFPDDATGVGVWCQVLLGVSVASAHNNHHVSTYVWPTCLQAGSGGAWLHAGSGLPWVQRPLWHRGSRSSPSKGRKEPRRHAPRWSSLLPCSPIFHWPKQATKPIRTRERVYHPPRETHWQVAGQKKRQRNGNWTNPPCACREGKQPDKVHLAGTRSTRQQVAASMSVYRGLDSSSSVGKLWSPRSTDSKPDMHVWST